MRIIETDFEWNKFLNDLAISRKRTIEEINILLEQVENGNLSIAEFRKHCKTTKREIICPEFLEDIPEKDLDLENLFTIIKKELYAQDIHLKNEDKNSHKYYLVRFNIIREQKVAEATVNKMFMYEEYAKLYKNDSAVLVWLFERLVISQPILAKEILKKYVKTLPVRIIKIAIKHNKSVAVDIQLEMDSIRMSFINLVIETKLGDEDFKDLISLLGESTKRFSSGNWYKKLYLDRLDFAQLIKEIYSLLYNYGELENVGNILSTKIYFHIKSH